MLLKTERLTVRHITAKDWESVKEIWTDFNSEPLSRYDKPHCTDDEDVRKRIAKWAEASKGTEHIFFAVCLENSVIGYISANMRECGYEIGYCFHSLYRKKGYAKESLTAVIDYLRTIGITKLTAGTAVNNIPSVHLLESLGFSLLETEDVSFYKDEKGNDIVFKGGIFELNLAQ